MSVDSEVLGRQTAPGGRWFNRNVLAIGLTSFLSDFCHEMATAVLPQFMQAIGSSAAALMHLLDHPSFLIIEAALKSLPRSKNKSARAAAKKALNDPNSIVRALV